MELLSEQIVLRELDFVVALKNRYIIKLEIFFKM